MIKFSTNHGDFTIELDHEKAPKTAANFEEYVKSGFYDGTIFHRVINNFMVQGGGFDESMKQKATREVIENEAANGLKNDRYTVAMARTNAPHSASSQFFINVVDNDFLNFRSADANGFGYCVFGKVVKGMEVVDKIEASKTTTVSYYQDVPVEAIEILDAQVEA